MASWVSAKIAEYLGEEEPQLRDFIVGKLRAHCKPADLLEELSVVMDEVALPFVLKLWRMLVYYSVKNA
jgi:RNA-binding protein 25